VRRRPRIKKATTPIPHKTKGKDEDNKHEIKEEETRISDTLG